MGEEVRDQLMLSIQSSSPELRCLGVRGLGRLSLFAPSMVSAYFGLLSSIAQNGRENELVRCEAIQSLVDLSLILSSEDLDSRVEKEGGESEGGGEEGEDVPVESNKAIVQRELTNTLRGLSQSMAEGH